MRKTIAVLLVIVASLFAFSACSTETPQNTAINLTPTAVQVQETPSAEPAQEKPVVDNLTGSWKFDDGNIQFAAEITANAIEMNLVANESEALYWAGTFQSKAFDGKEIVSKADVDALSRSLFGSQDKTKDFVYDDGTIKFKFRMMGVTKTVTLEKS